MSATDGTVTLRLYGSLRQAAGGKEVELEAGAETVQELLQRFACRAPRAGALLFDREGNLWRGLVLLLNEEPAPERQETRVKAGDVVSVLVPLAGG
jgi:molybdopterin converting factor small subunit